LDYLQEILQPYLEFLPYFGIAFLSSFLLTPIIGFLADKLEIIDIPAKLRKPTDKSVKTRIKKTVAPRAGALAVMQL
jgi:UDP-N-acetylmuramyl pentapeptide phosphotransferase/UDP-N-acetylglucosamine-1-phosphate transferase